MDSIGGGNTLVNEGYALQPLRKLLKTGSALAAVKYTFNEGYGLPRRSEHQPVRNWLKVGSASAPEALPFRAAAPDPDVFPRPGPDPSPDPEPNPVPLPPPDPDPGSPLDPLPTPAPVY
jgi:hypothetical protein